MIHEILLQLKNFDLINGAMDTLTTGGVFRYFD